MMKECLKQFLFIIKGTSQPDFEKCIVILQWLLGRNSGAWFADAPRFESLLVQVCCLALLRRASI